MKSLKNTIKVLVFFVFSFSTLLGQRGEHIERLYPFPDNTKTPSARTEIAASASQTFTFHFPNNKERSLYAGNCELVLWLDESAAGAGDNDSLSVSIYPLYRNPLLESYQTVASASKDSSIVVSDYDWGASFSANKPSVRAAITGNVTWASSTPTTEGISMADGVQVNVYTGINGQVAVLAELRVKRSSR